MSKSKKPKRWVYGTRTRKWYLIDWKDRDYRHGIRQGQMKKLGRKKAINEYLRGKMI